MNASQMVKVILVESCEWHYYLQVADLYSHPDPQEPVHLSGPQQLPVAGLVRGCGRQPARPHGEQGTLAEILSL